MTPKKPEPPKVYPSGPSGQHKKPSMSLRAPEEELEAATRAAEHYTQAFGFQVTRNDLVRAAVRVFSRLDATRAAETSLKTELRHVLEGK